MIPPVLPAGVADEMVEILFRESPPFDFKDLLLVGSHIEELDTAIDRYVTSEAGKPSYRSHRTRTRVWL